MQRPGQSFRITCWNMMRFRIWCMSITAAFRKSGKTCGKARKKLTGISQELDSQRGKMKNLKDEAKDQGNWTGYGNYTMQEIILGKVASGLRSTDLYNQKTVAGIQKGEKQITKAAQSLMITYDSLLKQRNTLEKLQELYAKQYEIAVNKHALGIGHRPGCF